MPVTGVPPKDVTVSASGLRFKGTKYSTKEVNYFRVSRLNYAIPVSLGGLLVVWYLWGPSSIKIIFLLVSGILLWLTLRFGIELMRSSGTRLVVVQPRVGKKKYAYIPASDAERLVAIWTDWTKIEELMESHREEGGAGA